MFVAHAWGKDAEGRDNNARTEEFCLLLKQAGFTVWLDKEQVIPSKLGITCLS